MTFTPITIPAVTANLTDKNFNGIAALYKITGTVKTAGGVGVAGVAVALSNPALTVLTSSKGVYTISNLPYQTAGTLTATKTGLTFDGPITVASMVADLTGQNFAVTTTFTITGAVKDHAGVGIEAVNVALGSSHIATDPTGAFTILAVPYGANGKLTASKGGWAFSAPVTVRAMVADLTIAKNFIGTPVTYKISGTIKDLATWKALGGVRIDITGGTTIPVTFVTTKPNGSYTISNVPYDVVHSVILTPSKTGYSFFPVTITLTAIATNQINQNFVGIKAP
jgi:hypothetical protein